MMESKDPMIEFGRYIIYHLVMNTLFNLLHLLYINFSITVKGYL